MTAMTTAPQRSNSWSVTARRVRRSCVCTLAVCALVCAGYAPGAFALAALAHLRVLP